MKALSIQPFYATLIATGEKFIELRSWKTYYRGWILICSGQAKNKKEAAMMVCGQAVAVAELEDVRPYVDETDRDPAYLFDDETFEGYSWVFKRVIPIEPIPVKGQLNLFNADVELDDLELLDIDYEAKNIPAEVARCWYEQGYIQNLSFWEDV